MGGLLSKLISLLFIDSHSEKSAEAVQCCCYRLWYTTLACLTCTAWIPSQRSEAVLRAHTGSYSTFQRCEELPSACEWLLFGSPVRPEPVLSSRRRRCSPHPCSMVAWLTLHYHRPWQQQIPQCVWTDNSHIVSQQWASTFALLFFGMLGGCNTVQGVCFHKLSLENL